VFGALYPGEADAEHARASLRRFSDQRISLTDATIAALAVREGAQVATFDLRHFTLMGAAVYPFGSEV
jgi:predicted nucleic acid-binding protein